ncbi:hypothetical protein J5N97_024023 [Dioscorea zingiberensis]|uniref:Short-chain dehydrogenase/reductase n=1 Tax=Dioscorea zingiberensis TaxID=325984 RepID=A0A9D5C5N7_9LILI|nr:hypothetical protein J5N97_024023 [Dioscorea zingiberensis]
MDILTAKRIAVVTGANKGIGLEIVRQLAFNGVMVILTARNEKRGAEAVEKLIKSGVSDVVFHQLDVADPASVASLSEFIKTKFERVDILVNNAGVASLEIDSEVLDSLDGDDTEVNNDDYSAIHQEFDSVVLKELGSNDQQSGGSRFLKVLAAGKETYEKAKECLDINFYGTKRVTEALIPLLQLSNQPRIVNVSSIHGQLQYIPNESIQKQFDDVNDPKEEIKLDEILQKFLNDMQENKLEENGWPTFGSAYKVSKAAMNTYTRILAKRYPSMCINSVHPGYVKTDITWNSGILTVEEGASYPVILALLPDGSPSGLFYDKMEVISF